MTLSSGLYPCWRAGKCGVPKRFGLTRVCVRGFVEDEQREEDCAVATGQKDDVGRLCEHPRGGRQFVRDQLLHCCKVVRLNAADAVSLHQHPQVKADGGGGA